MLKKDTKKYHHYSPSFYEKNTSLFETSSRAKLGFANLAQYQKNLKPRSIDLFSKFSA
jgi:V-type H+-transporting ATPase subunit H